jgi:aspartate carbamoyltransferase regulatory subunit
MAKPRAVHTVESIMAKTVEEGECLIWQGYIANRTPMIYADGAMKSVRGLLTRLLGKPQPAGVGFWSMKCGNHACVHPEHAVFRPEKQHMQHMAKELNSRPAINEIRRAKISQKRRMKLTDEQIADILSSEDSGPVVAARVGVSRAMVSRYRRAQSGTTIATNMWIGLMK